MGFVELPLSFSCDVCALQNLNICHFRFSKEIIVTMSCVMPTTSGPNDYTKKTGRSSLSLSARGFTTLLYTKVPKLFSSDGPRSFIRKDFVDKYDLCYLGMSPKHIIRLLKDCTKEDIEKCFGPIVNKNGHQYIKCLDPKLITKVERL